MADALKPKCRDRIVRKPAFQLEESKESTCLERKIWRAGDILQVLGTQL